MDNGANNLNDLKTLFLWDVRLGKDHDEMKLMSLKHGVIPFLEDKLVIISFVIFHGSVVEGQGFEYTNPRID